MRYWLNGLFIALPGLREKHKLQRADNEVYWLTIAAAAAHQQEPQIKTARSRSDAHEAALHRLAILSGFIRSGGLRWGTHITKSS